MECTRRQVCAEEARGSYAAEIVHEVPSNTVEEMESNITRVVEWVRAHMARVGAV
jgi:adenylate kinase